MAIVSSSSGRKPPRRPEALVDPQPAPEEVVIRPEDKLRPQRLNDYIGQSELKQVLGCLLYTSPSPRDMRRSRMPSSA